MTFRQFAYNNVVRNRRVYAAFFMASVFSVAVFFLYSMLLFHPSIEDRFLQEIAFVGMGFAEVTLYVFTLFFLFYSMRAFLQARSKEFGILIHLGMAKRQLQRLIFLETMLIGAAAIGVGTFFGFLFSKFFFMIVREIVRLPALPLYIAWEPFALTVGAFLSLFIIIALIAPIFIRTDEVNTLIHEDADSEHTDDFSPVRGYLGLFLLIGSYVFAATTKDSAVIGLIIVLPPIALLATYLFFTDTLPLALQWIRKHKWIYWRRLNLLSVTEGIVRLKENARMFFLVTIVSTVAFMSVGVLASLTSFASQYREVNPLGMTYKSAPGNPDEARHINGLIAELGKEEIDYDLVRFTVMEQQSSTTAHRVTILKASDMNELAMSFNASEVALSEGEAIFLPASQAAARKLKNTVVQTVLQPSDVPVIIRGAYTENLFPAGAHGTNAIILNDIDFEKIVQRPNAKEAFAYTYYAFYVSEWQATKEVGRSVERDLMSLSVSSSFRYDNPGASYSILRMTFSLLLFIGLLLAGVLFLAAGSFIYFRLYTSLDRGRAEYDVLRRLGVTNKEFKKIVNRQLMPQFFFPWGVALLHSAFAFMSLQVIWGALAEISIRKEMLLVLGGFTLLQLVYFYLIRWRYLAHVRAPLS